MLFSALSFILMGFLALFSYIPSRNYGRNTIFFCSLHAKKSYFKVDAFFWRLFQFALPHHIQQQQWNCMFHLTGFQYAERMFNTLCHSKHCDHFPFECVWYYCPVSSCMKFPLALSTVQFRWNAPVQNCFPVTFSVFQF